MDAATRARKPISQMSTYFSTIAPGMDPSPSDSPAQTQFTKAEGDDVSHKQMYAETKKEDGGLTIAELKKIEHGRRSLLLRAELPAWRIILCWTGTCLTQIVTDSLIWGSVSIYVAIRIFAYSIDYQPDSVEALSEDNNLEILGGFLSFFLVLFVNQTNGRFLEMYGFSKASSGRIQDLAGLAKAHLPTEVAVRLVRHLNAAHISGYVGLNAIGHGSPYGKANFFDYYNSQYHLLTPEEMKFLSHLDVETGLFMKELVTWCQVDVKKAQKAGHIDEYMAIEMNQRILQFRASMDGMYDYTDQPPHFLYLHFLVLLSTIYLPLFAIDTGIAAGWGDSKYIGLDLMNFMIVFLQCIFVVGLRALGVHMIDPYGDDLEDLSVISYIEGTLEVCGIILKSRQPEYTDQ